jgi:hypothetical protein
MLRSSELLGEGFNAREPTLRATNAGDSVLQALIFIVPLSPASRTALLLKAVVRSL